MLHPMIEEALDDLLVAWQFHDQRRALRAEVPELARSRALLDEARARMSRLRRALHPEEHEAQEAAAAAHCPTLDSMVILYPRDGNRCVCGHTVTVQPAG